MLGDKVIYSGSGYRDKWCPRGGIHVWNPETNETRELLPEDEYRFYFLQHLDTQVILFSCHRRESQIMKELLEQA